MASLFCPVCGTENPSTRLFCRKCASDLHAPAPAQNAAVEPEPAPVPVRPILIGIGVAALLIVLLLGALALLGGSPAESPSAAPTSSAQPTTALTPAPTEAPLPVATNAAIATDASTPEPASAGSPAPGESGTPVVDSFTGPRTASCTEENGTGIMGYVRLKWVASNTTGVRLSIDPPAANKAYDYGYDDYAASGTADLPFTCDPPKSDAGGAYHLYVATTVHDGGYFAWRFIKVYVKA